MRKILESLFTRKYYTVDYNIFFNTEQQKKMHSLIIESAGYKFTRKLSHFVNAVCDFHSHVRVSDNCIEDDLRPVTRYLLHTGC